MCVLLFKDATSSFGLLFKKSPINVDESWLLPLIIAVTLNEYLLLALHLL